MGLPGNNFGSLFQESQSKLDKMCSELEEQTKHLEFLVEQGRQLERVADHHWLKGNVVCDASGNGQVVLTNQVGATLELISWFTAGGSASNGGVVFLYGASLQNQSGAIEPQNGFWAAPITQYAADKFQHEMTVPVNGTVVVQFLAMGNGQQCFVNIYTRLVERRLNEKYKSQVRGW